MLQPCPLGIWLKRGFLENFGGMAQRGLKEEHTKVWRVYGETGRLFSGLLLDIGQFLTLALTSCKFDANENDLNTIFIVTMIVFSGSAPISDVDSKIKLIKQ